MRITPLADWIGPSRPCVIAGPCSAESEQQLLGTARLLSRSDRISAFRAGVWKARTRPSGFEGVGAPALAWLATVKQETGLRITVEVANRGHVEACLAAGVDILWIGARTATCPFAVQEVADALQGTDVAVLVKNPMNPDLGLWMGALERVHGAGIEKLAAVHRGFTPFDPSVYRNVPHWQLAVELRRRLPELPLLSDPSHIAGKRELIETLAHTALDLGLDGLMIESHIDPAMARTDRDQQLAPVALLDLLDVLGEPRHGERGEAERASSAAPTGSCPPS